MKDVFETFSIHDYSNNCIGMDFYEFVRYSREVLDSLDKLDISPKGYYHGQKCSITRLKTFIREAINYVSTDGQSVGGCHSDNVPYLSALLQNMKKGLNHK